MNANPARPPRKTRFTVVGGCLLAALIGVTLAFVGTQPYRCRCNRELSATHGCIANMKQIAGAKQLWMLEKNKTTNDVPTWSELAGFDGFLKDIPQCVRGGSTIGKISEPPTCSIADHNEYYRTSVASAKRSTTNTTP